MHPLDHHKDKTDYLAGSIDQLRSTFTSILKMYYYKNVKLWGKKGHLPELFAICGMYTLWLFRGPNVRGIQDHKMQGFLALTIYKHLNLNNLM